MSTYDRNKYLKYKERIISRQKLHRDNQEVRLSENKWRRNNYRMNLGRSLYHNAKNRAKRKGIEFNLRISDIEIPEYCPYLHIKLSSGTYSDRKKGNSPTVDRIDATIGYIPSNIEIISDLANRMKQNANKEQLLTFAKSVLSHFDNK